MKELLGVIAYKEEDDEDALELEELEGISDDRVTGLQEENEENEKRKRREKERR